MKEFVGLDFETYGEVNLPKHGLDNYVNGKHFRPLLAAVVERAPGGAGTIGHILDFVEDYESNREYLKDLLDGRLIAAHNAGFEQAVLERMDIGIPSGEFIDTAVLARAAGAGGKLEAAAAQLLGDDKLEIGFELIKLFSIPGKYQEALGIDQFDPTIIDDHPDQWRQFIEYCGVDAELSLRLAELLLPGTSAIELANNAVTMDMNNTGWHVDVAMVEEMHRRYQANLDQTVAEFRSTTNAVDLNLSSFPQLQAWCAARGVRATSFDEAHVQRLITSLTRKLSNPSLPLPKQQNYLEVLHLLHTKQAMGGSSLKKLVTILDTVSVNNRLHDQYLHIGAGASYRTTGRGVQMQNLKRLNGEGDDMAELFDSSVVWPNDKLASNLRQVFTATDPLGFLIVGDFASVESRGLAWQAGEQWKVDAYRSGEDLYRVQAGLIFGKSVDLVNKSERQTGKVGELACGYGAGPDAVREFAAKMGVELSDGESAKLVKDWRAANPRIVWYWERLHEALMQAVTNGIAWRVTLPHGVVRINPVEAPLSLQRQVGDPDLKSLKIRLLLDDDTEVLTRVIHGVHLVGRNIHYWKPSERKTGDLWRDRFTNPKTKRQQAYTIYGGKLAGILTQSLCREVFFHSLRMVAQWVNQHPNVGLVGQFHDEIVLDWTPTLQPTSWSVSLNQTMVMLEQAMTTTILPEFPLAAEIKHDYRYTK